MATFHLWKDNAGKFYWTIKSDENHKIIAMSSESYEARGGATHGIDWVRRNAKDAGFIDHT